MSEYVFDDKKDIVSYVYNSLSNPTPVKLQKALYFLWAFYSVTYGNIDYNDSEFDSDKKYPKYLFKPEFEAWKYGPVDNTVYRWDKDDKIRNFENAYLNSNEQSKEIKLFMDDLIKQVDTIDDFGLINRACKDKSYVDAYNKAIRSKIESDSIKEDYLAYMQN